MEETATHRLEDRAVELEEVSLASCEHCDLTSRGKMNPAGDGGLQEAHAMFGGQGRQAEDLVPAKGRHLDPSRTLTQERQETGKDSF
jgi:hypothetical protein